MLRLRSKVQNQVDAVLHERFHQNAEHERGNGVDLLASEGASKKVVKVLERGLGKTSFKKFSPRKKGSPRKNSKVPP